MIKHGGVFYESFLSKAYVFSLIKKIKWLQKVGFVVTVKPILT